MGTIDEISPAPMSENMAPPPTIDIAAYVKGTFGDEVVGPGDSPGFVKVKHIPTTDLSGMPAPSGSQPAQYIQVDAKKMLADAGADPDKVKIQLGTPQQPLNENPMGFIDRVKFSLATEPSNKMKMLKEQYGSENVSFNPTQGQFIVKQGDTYYNATNPGIEAGIVAKSPNIAGNIAGSVVGSVAGPVGTIAGGTIGSAIGQVGTVAMAHALGIRDEVDVKEVSKELGKEMLWNVAFGTAPYAIAKAGFIGIGAVSKAFNKADDMIANPNVRAIFSRILGGMTGEDPVHYAVALNNPEEWSAAQKTAKEWETQRLASAGAKEGQVEGQISSPDNEVNPIKLRMADRVKMAIERGKRAMIADYGAVVDSPEVIEAAGKAKVDINALSVQSTNGQTVDVEKQLMDLRRSIGESSPNDKRAIEKVLSDLNENRGGSTANEFKNGPEGLISNAKPKTQISYAEAREMTKRVNRILDAQGAFERPEMQVSTETQRALTMYKDALKTRSINGLLAVDESIANRVSAAEQQYATRKGMLGDLGNRNAFEPGNIDTSLSKLGGPKGERLRQTLSKFLGDTGDTAGAQELLRKIDIDNSVLHTSKLFTGGATTKSAIGAAGKKAAQVTAQSVGMLQRWGQSTAFMANRSEAVRKELFNNPAAMNALVQMFSQSIQTEQQTRDQLTEQALQSTQPVGQ